MIRILIIDKQNLVLEGLKVLLESEEQFKVIGTAQDDQQGIELVEQLKPDIVIIDPVMSQSDGMETIYSIVQKHSPAKVIIYTGSESQMLNQAILAGAKGYLLKDSSTVDLTAAIYAVHRENVYIGKGVLDGVRLSSFESQESKIKDVNLWLAKEIIDWWRDVTPVQDFVAEEMIENLNFSRGGLSQMKQHLCHQKDKNATLTEDAVIEIEELFAQIANSARPKQQLREDKQLILNLLDENNTDSYWYINTLRDNFKFLQAVTSKNVSKAISSINQQVSPLPLLAFFQSTQKYLSDWQEFLEQESRDNLENKRAAIASFERVLQSKNKHLQKQDICKKAAILALKSQIEAEVCSLVALIVAEAIEQFGVEIDILNKTNSFLLESIKQLPPHPQTDSVALSPYIEQLHQKTSIEELQRNLEELVGCPLNQWGVSRAVSHGEITKFLLEKLEPITREIHSDLRREALAISFLEYAQDQYQ
ncbi:MAG: response regulator transcription factor [Cyanobacteria bacterium P01_A01_bin.83]